MEAHAIFHSGIACITDVLSWVRLLAEKDNQGNEQRGVQALLLCICLSINWREVSLLENEHSYFSDCGEWSAQEREFARRAIRSIGLNGWHELLAVQKRHGTEAFLREVRRIWPDGAPPGEEP